MDPVEERVAVLVLRVMTRRQGPDEELDSEILISTVDRLPSLGTAAHERREEPGNIADAVEVVHSWLQRVTR